MYVFFTRRAFSCAIRRRLGEVLSGDHEEAARVAVEAMNDAGPAHTGDPAEGGAAVAPEEGVDEGPALMAGRGVDHQPGGLVDNEQVVVLVHDGHRDIRLRLRRRRLRRRAPRVA